MKSYAFAFIRYSVCMLLFFGDHLVWGGTWNGGGGDNLWNTGLNWGGAAPAAGEALNFAGTTRLTPSNNIAADTAFGNISFSSGAGAFTLSGNQITLNGDISNNSLNTQIINNAMILSAGTHSINTSTSNITLGGALSGAGGLTKEGSNTLTISTQNSFTGTVTVNAGTLIGAGGNTANGAIGSATSIIVNNGGTISNVGDNNAFGIVSSALKTIRINSGGTITTGTQTAHLSHLILDGGTLLAGSTSPWGSWNLDQGVSTGGSGLTSTITGGNASLTQVGGTIFNVSSGDTINVSTVLEHTGVVGDTGVIKQGNGILALSGANTTTAAISVTGGVLNIRHNTALGTVAAGTSVSGGAALQLQGGITVGAEALTLNGSGISNDGAMRNISGSNNYGGLVTLGSSTRINSDAGTLTLSNAGTITGAGFGLTVGGAGDTTIASVIGTGTGTLSKDGSGVATLTGANTTTGTATINGGVLSIGTASGGSWSGSVDVNSTGTLKGRGNISGNVTVNSGGTYSPGNSPGIQNIGGNLTLQPGATTVIEIDGPTAGNGAGFHDKIIVAGTASINGTLKPETIFTGSSGYTPAPGTKVTMLTSAGLRGQFTAVDNSGNPASISFLPEYTTTDVNLYVTPGSTWGDVPGLSSSGQQVGLAMEGFRAQGIGVSGSPLTDAQKINRALLGKSGGEVASAIEQMNPEKLFTMGQQAIMSSRAMDSMIGNRILELRSSEAGMSVNGISMYDMNGDTVYEAVADAFGGILLVKKKTPRRWGFFASGSGLFEDVDVASGRSGYYTKTGASICGVDYRLNDSWTVGVLLGQSYSISDFGNNAGTVEANSGRAGVMANYRNGPYYAGGMVGGGLISYDNRRNITFLEERAKGSTDGQQISSVIKSGYDFQYKKFVFGPALDLAYDRVWINKFDETGSIARLNIENQQQESFRTTLGVRGSYPIEIFPMRLIPTLGVGWEREYMKSADLRAKFAAGGDYFSIRHNPIGQDMLVVDQGWTLMVDRDLSVNVGYQGRFLATDYIAHGVNLGARVGF